MAAINRGRKKPLKLKLSGLSAPGFAPCEAKASLKLYMNNIRAVASIVIKELYRRKDFYVLFILTVLICLVMASVHFFNDAKIIRYLKEMCLLLVWISSLVIAITTTARQIPTEREN